MLPDLESLRCFEAAAVRLSFRAAARAVGLSPAAFSERIRRLEDDLGASLFERTTRRVRLTPEGETLLPHARTVLLEARRCAEVLRGDPSPFEMTLGTRFELGLSWLVPALGPLAALRPQRTLHLSFGDSPDLMSGLAQGRVDAVVTSTRLTRPKLKYALLHEEGYQFVGAPEVLSKHPLRGPDDAGNHVLLDISSDLPLFRYWRDGAPPEERWSFGRHHYLGTIGAIRELVLQGAGVAMLPSYFLTQDVAEGRLVEILPDRRPRSDWFRLVWLEGHPRSADLEQLGADLRERPLT